MTGDYVSIDDINLTPSELSVSTYVEIIIVEKAIAPAGIEFDSSCGIDCNYYTDFKIYRDLIVRVAGYSDYFVRLSEPLQNFVIERTKHEI